MKTILVSGGHLTPALAVIDEAKLKKKQYRFVFLGRTYSQESTGQISQEKAEVEKRDIPFIPTVAPKLHKTYWWRNFQEIGKFLPSIYIAWKTISQYQPDVFLSFGGYLAFPIALVCRIRRIKVVTHEQTSVQGMANQIIALLSDKVAVSYPSSLPFFSRSKTVLTGNPLRPVIAHQLAERPDWIPARITQPILYITGGNQGSEILNSVVEQTLPLITTRWFVIHQCGNPSNSLNYVERLQAAKQRLTPQQSSHYVVYPWIEEHQLAWVLSHATLAVSRSGANTTQELVINHLPALLIPLPFSHNQEQQKNAEVLANAGCAVILQQKDLTPETFLANINAAAARADKMAERAKSLAAEMITDGAERLIALLDEVMAKNYN